MPVTKGAGVTENSGFQQWMDHIRQGLERGGLRVDLRRDSLSPQLAMFWEGKSPAQAIDWLRGEGFLIAAKPLPQLRRSKWMKE